MNDSKELFDYWHNQVRLKNMSMIAAPDHVETQALRHDCTNYDDLRFRSDVLALTEPERSRVVAVIKYQCTAQVLQRRAGILKDRVETLQATTLDLEKGQTQLKKLIRALQEIIFGKEQDIQTLQNRIAILEAENEALKNQTAQDQAYAELLQELEKLKKQFAKETQRRQELGKNNQRLGGQVAHTKRFQRERDEARSAVQELRQQLAQVTEENQKLRHENESLKTQLQQFRQRAKLGIVEIRRNGHGTPTA
ncbi:MAG: hypothetical protein ACHWZW_18670 [Spirulina sp.]